MKYNYQKVKLVKHRSKGQVLSQLGCKMVPLSIPILDTPIKVMALRPLININTTNSYITALVAVVIL